MAKGQVRHSSVAAALACHQASTVPPPSPHCTATEPALYCSLGPLSMRQSAWFLCCAAQQPSIPEPCRPIPEFEACLLQGAGLQPGERHNGVDAEDVEALLGMGYSRTQALQVRCIQRTSEP